MYILPGEEEMAVSYNEDIKLGDSVFHVQTEYYKKSGKVVSNIFKDGLSIKRLEKSVDNEEDLDSAVAEFHRYVVERLRSGAKKKVSQEKGVFAIPEPTREEILRVINPYFGVASSFVLEEALSASSNPEDFVDHLLDGLPEDLKEGLREELIPLISSSSTSDSRPSQSEERSSEPEEFTEEKKEKLLKVLSEYFGIMALSILEESLEEWNGDYHRLVELIVSHLEDEKEREELYNRLMFL